MLVGNAGNARSESAEYQKIKDNIVSMVNEGRPFDSAFFSALTIEELRLESVDATDNGKTIIWWISWAVSMGRTEAFEMAWLKHRQEFLLEDFRAKAIAEPNAGVTAMLLLAYATKTHPAPFKRIWQRWGGQVSAQDLQAKAEVEPAINISMISVMLRAAKENKIKRETIDHILATFPNVFCKDDLSYKPTNEPSIAEFIEQGIKEGCDWSVRIKRIIDARNAFFESLANLTKSQNPNQNDFFSLNQLAGTAYNEGYLRAHDDTDLIVAIISAAQKKDWIFIFRLLENNASNEFIMNEDVYNSLSGFTRKQGDFLVINQLNKCFGKNRQYNHEDFAHQYQGLNSYEKRFKLSDSFVSHALVKKGPDNRSLSAIQYPFTSAPANTPAMMRLKSIHYITHSGIPVYEATAVNDQKMVSTDVFNIELQTKVGATIVCEKFDLVFLVPKNGELGFLVNDPIDILKPDITVLVDTKKPDDDEVDEGCPIIRGSEREISLVDMHMRRTYPNPNYLKKRDQQGLDSTLHSKTALSFNGFFDFYKDFFTDSMTQIANKTYEAKWLFSPEVLHAIAKQFYRPSEKHYDARNLAIAPKWVNSLMMVIECALGWNVIHSPFAKFKLHTIFRTFPMHHVLREGKIEASLTSGDTQVKISKDLVPYQKNPPFPRITDITQATFVLNCLLNGQNGQQIPLATPPFEPQKPFTIQYDSASRESSKQTVTSTSTHSDRLVF